MSIQAQDALLAAIATQSWTRYTQGYEPDTQCTSDDLRSSALSAPRSDSTNPLQNENEDNSKLSSNPRVSDLHASTNTSFAERAAFQLGSRLSQLLFFTTNPALSFQDMDLLAIMKFICRDVWKLLFHKQIDNLKTNHRGTFYLIDLEFRPIVQLAPDRDHEEEEERLLKPFLDLPVGAIKGVLHSMGYSSSTCTATLGENHNRSVSFHVQVQL